MEEDLLKRAMREIGARGGRRRRNETMTPEQRAESARAAGKKSGEVRAAKAAAKKAASKSKRRTEAA